MIISFQKEEVCFKINHIKSYMSQYQNSEQNLATQIQSSEYVKAFRFMLMARMFDERMASLYRAGRVFGGVFLGLGQEALSVSIGMALETNDVFSPLIRDTAGRFAWGETILDAARTYLGSALGPMRGRDGNVHRGYPLKGLLPMISHLGSMVSVVNGILFARRLKGLNKTVGVASVGDGATSTGSFHEAVNQAAIERLPLVIVVANNQYAYSTHVSRQFACKNLVDRAIGYGIKGHLVDGTDLADCLKTVKQAVALARNGSGPQLVVAELLRLCGHGEHDDASYVDPKIKQSHLGRDCVTAAESVIKANGWLTESQLQIWKSEISDQIETAIRTAMSESGPDPAREQWTAISTRRLSNGKSAEIF